MIVCKIKKEKSNNCLITKSFTQPQKPSCLSILDHRQCFFFCFTLLI
jgi:hypothetical protein